jgi:hypothetical protein
MPVSRPRLLSPRRFAWLLWLGLLLPVAQVAAACHALSHGRGAASGEADDKQAPQASHCDLCLAAAAIAGSAPLGEPPAFVPPAIRHDLPQRGFAVGWLALPVRAYLSRAPPEAWR